MDIIKLTVEDMRGKQPAISPINGCFIAGGAIRSWFTGRETSRDIDVFFTDSSSAESFKEVYLKDLKPLSETKNAHTFTDKDGNIIQTIMYKHPDVRSLFDSFDFTICQFTWTSEGIFTTKEAIISSLRNHLAVHAFQPGFEVDSLRRAFKYAEKGFKPCWGTLRDIAKGLQGLSDEKIQESVEISPSGGKRLVTFD